MKNIYLSFLLSLLVSFSFGQAGLQVYTGISQAKNKSKLITPDGGSHKGYHLGADARLNSGNMYFVVGGQYHVIEYLGSKPGGFFSVDNKMSWAKLRVGLGFNIVNFDGTKIALRAKALGALDLISKRPELADAPYQNYNSGTAGAVIGLGFDLYLFTFDVEYEKGFFNAVNMVKGTEFDFFTISVGVRF